MTGNKHLLRCLTLGASVSPRKSWLGISEKTKLKDPKLKPARLCQYSPVAAKRWQIIFIWPDVAIFAESLDSSLFLLYRCKFVESVRL